MVRLTIKPTAGGDKLSVEAEADGTVGELKELIAPLSSISADQQRLVWRGQILKDERTLADYGEGDRGLGRRTGRQTARPTARRAAAHACALRLATPPPSPPPPPATPQASLTTMCCTSCAASRRAAPPGA